MRYYIWLNEKGLPVSKAWPYVDETERMVEETRPPEQGVTIRTGTKEQLTMLLHLSEKDFADE
jgi:hypothetical protein